ncbi:MAG TPA: protein kinase [Polyangiales bacterium]|nr:protein kinase [Polyangiales bacterium]
MELPRPFAFPLHPPALAGQERRLGSYELLDELATGRTFRIDLAMAPSGNAVALKRLRGESTIARDRLLREARVASALTSPNLPRAYELLHEPEPALAIEYVHGLTLRQLLGNAQPADLRHAVTALLGALHGLAALHAHGLVHQAPVARHVLVGIDGVTRLIDLSHLHGAVLGETDGAEQGLVLSELAPEQIQARDTLDPRCDVFIAGGTLRELLAGCRMTQRTPLDDVWRRATAPRREERYLSAREMVYALSKAVQRAGLTSTPEELGAWVRGRLYDERPSGARPALSPRRSSSPVLPPHAEPVSQAWVEHAHEVEPVYEVETELDGPRTSFVPPRVSLPRAMPSQERLSSVWYAVEAQASDDDIVRAIAASKPLRPKRGVDLRGLGSGVTMGCLALCGLIAMGASPHDDRAQLPPPPAPSVQTASMQAASVLPTVVPSPAPQPVPAAVPAARAPELPPALRDEPWQRSESLARRAQPRPKRAKQPRQLIRMTGSVPDNPF